MELICSRCANAEYSRIAAVVYKGESLCGLCFAKEKNMLTPEQIKEIETKAKPLPQVAPKKQKGWLG